MMLLSIGRRASGRCCRQRHSSAWRVLRPASGTARAPHSIAGSAACCVRAYSSRSHGASSGSRGISSARQAGPPSTVAVLGGGVTGLTTAYYLAKLLPSARITLYESSDRLGGWVDSHTMDLRRQLPDGTPARVVCEYGPRLITPTSKNFAETFVYAELLHDLGLTSKAWTLPHGGLGKSPDGEMDTLARRYIYYPDHLVELTAPRFDFKGHPWQSVQAAVRFAVGMAGKLVREPLLTGAVGSLTSFMATQGGARSFKKPLSAGGAKNRHELAERLAAMPDQSVGAYFTRRFGGRRSLVDNVLSAMVHGIYGGSPWNLSVQSSLFRNQAIAEAWGGLATGFVIGSKADVLLAEELALALTDEAKDIRNLVKAVLAYQTTAATGFLNGFSTFTNAMADALRANPNVTIKLNEPVTHLAYIQAGHESAVRVKTTKSSQHFNKVISTLYGKTLAGITDGRLPALADMEAVTMQVVNLYYPDPNLNHPHRGFGYLIPPTADVEPGVLGVLFDSDRDDAIARAQPPGSPHPSGDTVPGTKLTVMLRVDKETGPRSGDEACRLAHAVVCKHLGLPNKYRQRDRTFASVKTAADCIPQHTVGHRARLAAAHAQLLVGFGGRLAVAGPSYTAPGLLPAMRAARDVAAETAGRGYETYAWRMRESGKALYVFYDKEMEFRPAAEVVGVGDTGLARFRDDYTWASDFFPLMRA